MFQAGLSSISLTTVNICIVGPGGIMTRAAMGELVIANLELTSWAKVR